MRFTSRDLFLAMVISAFMFYAYRVHRQMSSIIETVKIVELRLHHTRLREMNLQGQVTDLQYYSMIYQSQLRRDVYMREHPDEVLPTIWPEQIWPEIKTVDPKETP